MAARFVGGARLFTFGNGGSSTDAASLAELFARPPWGRPLPARCLVDDSAVLTALGNDVGFDLVFVAPAHRSRCSRGHRRRDLDQRQLTQRAHRLCRGPNSRAGHGRAGRVRRRRDGGCARPAALPRRALGQRAPDPGDPGGAWVLLVGGRPATIGRRRWLMPCDREAKVIDRIEAYRRRRPRLTDEVVTMAHGAGGKASAALVDAVFLEAFARGEPGPLADAATLALPDGGAAGVHDRLLRRPAPALPGRIDRSPRGARHGERPRRVRSQA